MYSENLFWCILLDWSEPSHARRKETALLIGTVPVEQRGKDRFCLLLPRNSRKKLNQDLIALQVTSFAPAGTPSYYCYQLGGIFYVKISHFCKIKLVSEQPQC